MNDAVEKGFEGGLQAIFIQGEHRTGKIDSRKQRP
jgi:hypothetical protein